LNFRIHIKIIEGDDFMKVIGHYIADISEIIKIKKEYLNTTETMKNMLNGKYSYLPYSDKYHLLEWGCIDAENRFELLDDGRVIFKDTKEGLREVLYQAIRMLVNKLSTESESPSEWRTTLLNDIGCTKEELAGFGIEITDDGKLRKNFI
jgi:hypothetical protein